MSSWFEILKRKWDRVEAKKIKTTDEGRIQNVPSKEKWSKFLPAGQYTMMDNKTFKGEQFSGKQIDKRTSTRYTEMTYPPKRDERGRLVPKKVTPQEARRSRKTGRHARSPYEGFVQAGQKKEGEFELDTTKPTPVPSGSGKFTMKEGRIITPIRLKNISFKNADFSGGLFGYYREQDPSGTIENCNFVNSKWNRTKLANVTFENCDFRKVDLTKAIIVKNVKMIRCNVRGASIPPSIDLIEPVNAELMHRGKRK